MRYAYSVEETRRLEAAAMSALGESGDDALMQRAAHGLSVRVAAELGRLRGRVYGAERADPRRTRATTVGTPCTPGPGWRLGVARSGPCAHWGKPHAAGLRALLSAGGRLGELATSATSCWRARTW